MISNIGKTLFVCLFFVVITGCVFDDIGVIVPELVRTDYTFDEIYDLLTEDLSKNSTIVKHPHSDQFVTNTGYSYFLEQYENKIELGKKNILEHEYLFEGGNIRAIIFFRNKFTAIP